MLLICILNFTNKQVADKYSSSANASRHVVMGARALNFGNVFNVHDVVFLYVL